MQGYTDTPIERLENDVMDVKVYVESLSEFILGCSTPMTIAIQGDWGSGKTSMMNMIKQAITEKIVPVWFNTWQYSQFEMASYLSISLLSNFLEKIGAESESQNFLKSIAKGAIAAAKTAVVVGVETFAGGTVAGNLKDNLEADKQDSAKALEELRDKIREAVSAKLKSSGKNRVVVFVDDLDRLAPEKAVELLEVLKVFMDVPNCVFVLAVDYGVVTQGLEKKFGVGVGHSKGRSFFDKIIQLPFAIPIAQY
ncbi:MAG TPA: P-loop NTPase fold protein, partial [Candidatus Competibacteraceae bacterium]|nr:P-loop NTPase fold protein [Candidatus Competibacteraceae bacterium]